MSTRIFFLYSESEQLASATNILKRGERSYIISTLSECRQDSFLATGHLCNYIWMHVRRNLRFCYSHQMGENKATEMAEVGSTSWILLQFFLYIIS